MARLRTWMMAAWALAAALPAGPGAAGAAPSLAPVALAAGKILVLGDSLSAGYGVAPEQAWPALLQARLRGAQLPYTVVNASISGQTSAGGRAALGPLLDRHRPVLVMLELGANDALRGQDLNATAVNLEQMARASRAAGAAVLLLGSELPPNYGVRYRATLRTLYAGTARRTGAALMPFLLAGIAQDAAAFQPDGLHPTAAALVRVAQDVWQVLVREYRLAPPDQRPPG